jgi:hypothetical protein
LRATISVIELWIVVERKGNAWGNFQLPVSGGTLSKRSKTGKAKEQEPLVELVAKGLVVEERMEDGRRVFGMNEKGREAIIRILKVK